MADSEKQEKQEKGFDKNGLRKRVRSCKRTGMAAALFTAAALAGAGYLTVTFFMDEPSGIQAMELSQEETSAEKSTSEETSAKESSAEETSAGESSAEETSAEKETAEEETTEEETTEEETSTISEEEKQDRLLRQQAVDAYDNLGVVNHVNNYLNMRTGPSTDDDICGKIFRYCGVNILKDAGNGWYQIESGGVTGYVSKNYIETGDKARELALKHCRYQAKVLTETLDVLKKPEEGSEVITTVKKDEYYDALSFEGDWIEIEAVEKLSGYVKTEDISAGYRLEEAIVFGYDDSISQTRIDIINKAFEYYGGKYVFGGESLTDGIDCSSFTQTIYGKFGVELTRNSYTQAEEGTPVSEKDIRPGDLVFYVGRYPGQIGHVAIYIGNGKIIHAASETKGICVSSWKFVPIVTIRDVIGDR